MKVPEIKSPSTTKSKKSKRVGAASRGNFSDSLSKVTEASGEPSAITETTSVSPVGAILAAQEVTDDSEQEARRQMAKRGGDILERLDEIRHDLLIGAIPKDRLTNLAQSLRAKRTSVSDPRLIEIIDEIELRAEVEIAKLTRDL
jgi:hypothetical protein